MRTLKAGYIVLALFGLAAASTHADEISYSSVPFRAVTYCCPSTEYISITFHNVYIERIYKDITVPLESVEMKFEESKSKYAVLHILDVKNNHWNSDSIKADKVVVVVNCKDDLRLWEEFLSKLKQKQDRERKIRKIPVRVLPPHIE